jgi:hypothetical protein
MAHPWRSHEMWEPHIVPLARQALDVLRELEPLAQGQA